MFLGAVCKKLWITISKLRKFFFNERLSLIEAIKHLAKFPSDIWHIHPSSEGNTRATTVFIIKYMRTFGLNVGNEAFSF